MVRYKAKEMDEVKKDEVWMGNLLWGEGVIGNVFFLVGHQPIMIIYNLEGKLISIQ